MPKRPLPTRVLLRTWDSLSMLGAQLGQVHPAWPTSLAVITVLTRLSAPIHLAAGAPARLEALRPPEGLGNQTTPVRLRESAGHKLSLSSSSGRIQVRAPAHRSRTCWRSGTGTQHRREWPMPLSHQLAPTGLASAGPFLTPSSPQLERRAMPDHYGTVEDAGEYHAARGNTAWGAVNEGAQTTALIRASQALDALYGSRYPGSVAAADQSLLWPRSGAMYRGEAVNDATVPLPIVRAT